MKSILVSSLLFSALYLILIGFRKISYAKYRKRTFRLLWIILILRLLSPGLILSQKIPHQWNGISTISKSIPIDLSNRISANTMDLLGRIQVFCDTSIHYFTRIWVIGFLFSLAVITIHYVYFHTSLNKSLVHNSKTEEIIRNYSLPIRVQITKQNISPFITGVFSKTLVLPQSLLELDNQRDLDYIILHEMVHIKKKDTLVKMLYIVARCIHWFNPLVYAMSKKITMDIEMACDETVSESLCKSEKIEYCNVLYKYCTMGTSYLPLYNTTFSTAGLRMKERFDCILAHKTRSGRGLLLIACLLVFTSVFISFELQQIPSHIIGTKISYTKEGDILVQSDKIGSMILRKMEEDSIIVELAGTITENIDLKAILNTGNIKSEVSKEDFDRISKIQISIWQGHGG